MTSSDVFAVDKQTFRSDLGEFSAINIYFEMKSVKLMNELHIIETSPSYNINIYNNLFVLNADISFKISLVVS